MSEGKPYDNKVDIWSIGCILYKMIVGKRPSFSKKDGKILLNKISLNSFNWYTILQAYQDSESVDEMVYFLRDVLVKDRTNRLNAKECLNHAWLK